MAPRRNRVDPWGDLHSLPHRGLFTGNRGCLVDDEGTVVRHHRGPLWIICLTDFRGWANPLAQPGRWTPIFFLDDAVGLAAGHRPCGLCRRHAYLAYRNAVTVAAGAQAPLTAAELNRRLTGERLRRGGGIDRAKDRRLWTADIRVLPVGSVVVDAESTPRLVTEDRLLRFGFDGWSQPIARPEEGQIDVLTPPTSVSALRAGFIPVLHPSAAQS